MALLETGMDCQATTTQTLSWSEGGDPNGRIGGPISGPIGGPIGGPISGPISGPFMSLISLFLPAGSGLKKRSYKRWNVFKKQIKVQFPSAWALRIAGYWLNLGKMVADITHDENNFIAALMRFFLHSFQFRESFDPLTLILIPC